MSSQLAGFVCFGVFRSEVLQRAFSVASNVYRIRWTVDARTFLLVWMKACDAIALEGLVSLVTVWILKICNNKNIKNIAVFHWDKKIGHGLDSPIYCKYCRLKPNCSQIFARDWYFPNRAGCDLVGVT